MSEKLADLAEALELEAAEAQDPMERVVLMGCARRLREGLAKEPRWQARAEWAEERLRWIAALLRIPDGARYQADVRAYADRVERTREERDRYEEALRYIGGADIAGYEAHMRPTEVVRKVLGS